MSRTASIILSTQIAVILQQKPLKSTAMVEEGEKEDEKEEDDEERKERKGSSLTAVADKRSGPPQAWLRVAQRY